MELNKLKIKGDYKIMFASGAKLNETTSSLTITAPQGMQVSLHRFMTSAGVTGYYSITVDGTNVITNMNLTNSSADGEFLINSASLSSGAVPALTGNSITINHVSGELNYTYGYVFIESK